ncbi:MAG: pirin family protein [Gammaproteobacteria bacterium]|nr:pirin family protein [Gammaproteobacteria bacterium]
MLKVRRSEDRGVAALDWLDSRHTFSFGDYFSTEFMGFGPLRVLNEDRVQPGRGFDTHGHQNMEIISYVLDGALTHRDSMGNGSTIRPGDVQRMSAGTGVRHSEFNGSDVEPVHFLQIWIVPERAGLVPGYEQKTFSREERRGALRLLGSRDGRLGSLTIHQDADFFATLLADQESVTHALAAGRKAWVQVARGAVRLNAQSLNQGDGAAVEGPQTLVVTGVTDAEVLLFDMS